MRALALCWIATLLIGGPSFASEETPPATRSYLQGQRIDPTDPKRESYYGWSVSASGDSVLVGMPYEFVGVTLTPGAAYVQRHNGTGWAQEAKLAASDGVNFDYFGEAVALSGDLAAVGAPDHQSGRGAVYLFQRNGTNWSQIAKLQAADPLQNARFGAALSFDGITLAISAPGIAGGSGAVYLFTAESGSWAQAQRIQPSDVAANDRFGQAVAIDGNTLVVGAPGKTVTVNGQGVTYAFERNGSSWTQQARWNRTGAQPGEGFGSAVSLSGNLAATASPYAAASGGLAGGVVETFRRNGSAWSPAGTLRSAAGSDTAQFGFALSLRGQRLLIGLAGDSLDDNLFQGSLESYLFEDNTWALNQRMVASDGEQEAQLGFSVSASADFAVSGAPGASNGSASYAGAAYAFENRTTQLQFSALPAQPVRIGESYTAGVSVSAGTGTAGGDVTIRDDLGNTCTAPLASGAGNCVLAATGVGPRSLRARYNGAPGFAESFGTASVQVIPDLRLQPASVPEGQIGAAYSLLFDTAATGATLPLAYSLTNGNLPPGLTLGGNGLLSGTPTDFGSFDFTVRVTDSSGTELGGPFSSSRAYTLLIQPPFRTTLTLDAVPSPQDRGMTLAFGAQLDVVEEGAAAPTGTYTVTAVNGTTTLNCAAAVSMEGLQTCSITFGPSAAVGDYVINAGFSSTHADFGNSSDSDSLRLLSPSDPSISLAALDALYSPGDSLRFHTDVQNTGPDVAYGLRIQVPAPIGLQNLAWTCSGAACPSPSGTGTPNITVAALAANTGLQIELRGDVGAMPPAQVNVSASLSLDPGAFGRDLDPDNNDASAQSVPLRMFRDGFESPED